MTYGLPYMGSKSKIAEWVVDNLPCGGRLVDLFAGGGAVSHCAALSGKYRAVHLNDSNWMPIRLFEDAMLGKYEDEERWISREDFFALRDSDPYVAIVWSFGNKMRAYLYGKDIEPYKKALHYAYFFGKYSCAEKTFGREIAAGMARLMGDLPKGAERYAALKKAVRDAVEGGGHARLQSAERLSNVVGLRGGGITEPPADGKGSASRLSWKAGAGASGCGRSVFSRAGMPL